MANGRLLALRVRLAAWLVRLAGRIAPAVTARPAAAPVTLLPDVADRGRFAVHVTYADGSRACVYRGDHGATARTWYEGQRTFADRRVVFIDGHTVRGDSARER